MLTWAIVTLLRSASRIEGDGVGCLLQLAIVGDVAIVAVIAWALT